MINDKQLDYKRGKQLLLYAMKNDSNMSRT